MYRWKSSRSPAGELDFNKAWRVEGSVNSDGTPLKAHEDPLFFVDDMRRTSGIFMAYCFGGFEPLCDDSPLIHGDGSISPIKS